MEVLNTIVDQLAMFAREQDLVARAKEGCSKFLHSAAEEDGLPRNLNFSDVRAAFCSHSLTFESSLLPYPFVSTRLDLYAGEDEVGWYKLIVRLDGQAEDDYLVFHPEPE
jgi:hypothetical protein